MAHVRIAAYFDLQERRICLTKGVKLSLLLGRSKHQFEELDSELRLREHVGGNGGLMWDLFELWGP